MKEEVTEEQRSLRRRETPFELGTTKLLTTSSLNEGDKERGIEWLGDVAEELHNIGGRGLSTRTER